MFDVMIVEDDPATYQALPILLENEGWTVRLVKTRNAGLALLNEEKPRAVILDLMLSDGDGADMLRLSKRMGWPISFIVITGIDNNVWLTEVAQLAPDLIMKKPIDLEKLITFLKEKLK